MSKIRQLLNELYNISEDYKKGDQVLYNNEPYTVTGLNVKTSGTTCNLKSNNSGNTIDFINLSLIQDLPKNFKQDNKFKKGDKVQYNGEPCLVQNMLNAGNGKWSYTLKSLQTNNVVGYVTQDLLKPTK